MTLYTIDCPKCKILEKKLDALNIEYTKEKDIEILKEKQYTILPILELDDGTALDFKHAIDYIKG